MPQNRDVDGIKVNKFFSGLKETVIAAIFNPKEFVEVSEGNMIYQTGEESGQVYLILRGEVKVKYPEANHVSSKLMNDFFGEKEMLEGSPRISTAVAHRNSLIYKIDKTIVMGLIAKYPSVKSNINQYGESKIPGTTFGASRIINIAKNSKPISFQAIRKTTVLVEEKEPEEESSIAFTPEIVESKPAEPRKTEPELPVKQEELKKDNLIINTDTPEQKFTKVIPESKSVNNSVSEPEEFIVEEPEETEIEDQLSDQKVAKIFERENIRKLLGSIDEMNKGITLSQTLESISKALNELTLSDGVELCLIDEKRGEIRKFAIDGENISELDYKLPDGLTGTCALQKKIINFERPTEDSRFKAKLDQPGSSNLKRIMYFPVINDAGDTIAVIQLAREIKKFGNEDIANLNMISKIIEGALEKSIGLENIINTQQLSKEKVIEKLILNDIHSPIKIINSYIELLSDKKLPAEVEEVLRMLQKQVTSVEDVIKSIFSSVDKDSEVELGEVQFNELIDDVLELLSEYCESREVKLYKKIGDGAVVKIDRGKFYTAVFQVIKFACNNSKKDGRIYFSTDLVGDKVQVQIKDEGKGIDQELQSRFFKQQHDVKAGNVDDYGLNIAKKLIEAHSGQVSLESKKNEGTTILITLNTANN